ncbi:MAG: hypothetical protein GY750_20345 [Lentisphaerae bacterium]|nr:hypothetical protein [Lentisphaerota bacterium]MCP4103745.1 hypothetical protein [Lentisphaerota bacterium]
MDFKNTIKLVIFMLVGILLLTAAVFLLPFLLLAVIIYMLLPNRKNRPFFQSAKQQYSKFRNGQAKGKKQAASQAAPKATPASQDVIDVVAKEVDNND